MAGESSINPLRNQTPLTTFARNLRKKEVFPYVSSCHPLCVCFLGADFVIFCTARLLGCAAWRSRGLRLWHPWVGRLASNERAATIALSTSCGTGADLEGHPAPLLSPLLCWMGRCTRFLTV